MAFLVNGLPQNGYAKGSPPTGPTSARFPFMDNLRISRYAMAYKLTPVQPSDIVSTDIVVLQTSNGDLLQFDGEKILYVLGTNTEQDGSTCLKVLPYQEFLTFSQSDVPPYLQIAIDNDRLRTLIVSYEDVPGEDRLKRVTGLEQTALDTDYLYPTGNRFFLINGPENKLIVPYTVLKHFVLDNSYKITILCNNQDYWTLLQNMNDGWLYYEIEPENRSLTGDP